MAEILTKERVKKITFLDKQIEKAVKEMIKIETNLTIKACYEKVLYNLKLPKNYYLGDSLVSAVFKIGKHFIASEILGQHKQNLKIVRHGKMIKVIPQGEIIEIPIDLLFYGGGDKLTWKGVHTYLHELSHDPLRDPVEFSKLGLNRTRREEWTADLLSARFAVKLGYPPKRIYELYKGRESVYGRFPFKTALEKATRPKERPETKIVSVRELRKRKEREKMQRLKQLERERRALHRRAA